MSVKRALEHINFLLEVLNAADQKTGVAGQKIDFLLDVFNEADQQSGAAESSISGVVDQKNVKYFDSCDDIREGMTVRVTIDMERLNSEWKESGLGSHSELHAFLGQVGKVTEIEDDDDTLQLRWENYDTCWIPLRACFDAKGAKETLPGMANSWLGDSALKTEKTEKSRKEEPKVNEVLFEGVEDDAVKTGNTVRVTSNLAILDKTWKEAELGENDTKNVYLGTIGKIVEIEEDDDTVQLQWGNFDTVWIPIKACMDAKGAEATLPGATVSWLA